MEKSTRDKGGTPVGNVLLSWSILFSGGLPSQLLRALQSINIAGISSRTFFRHQSKYLNNVVNNVWFSQRNTLFNELQGTGLVVGADGRCDSMGHSAKYGSYTAMDLDRNKVLTVELVQSNEVKSSTHMELKGLQKMVQVFNQFNITVTAIVTDRHRQIQKWIRENWQTVHHYFDCWHIAKSIKKRLQSLDKKKSCQLLGSWIKSIVNHFYWSVMSTEPGNEEIIELKWKSLVRHLQNIHHGHGEMFPSCMHPPLSDLDLRTIKWFKPDTEEFDGLKKIIETKMLVNDIKKCSSHGQTSAVEGYHSLVNHFAPKMHHFSFNGMKSRLFLAAMHYNENSGREQQQNKEGDLQYAIAFPKYNKGGYIVRKILVDCTYDYADAF